MNRKGFFFIIVAFVLLAYILTSTYYWVRAIEMEESRYSDSFRTSAMEMLVAQVTQESITEFTNISARYAFYRLNHHSIENPVLLPDTIDMTAPLDGSENENIKLAMHELILYGTASEDYFDGEPLNYTNEEKLTYSLEGWGNQLNASLAASNFELVEFGIDEDSFQFAQSDFTAFNVSFVMNLTVEDLQDGSMTSIVRTYNINTIVDATGMIDPYIARESRNLDLEVEGEGVLVGKPIFMAPLPEYPDGFESLCSQDATSGQCYHVDDADEGQGWFYGPVVMAEDAGDVPENATYNYILAGNYSAIVSVPNYKYFGAYILTNTPTLGGDCPDDQADTFNALDYDGASGCTDVEIDDGTSTFQPFMVYEDFDIDDFWGVDLQSADESAHKLLFIAEASPSEVESDPELKLESVSVYDIEMLRDFVMCGYYLPRNNSPSFLHRMMDDQAIFAELDTTSDYGYQDWPESEWGFETTAVGRWAGGNIVPDAEAWDEYSRVDVEFFSEIEDEAANPVQMIKGMPGCKNVVMCNQDLGYDLDFWHVGHFRLSNWAQDERDEGYGDIYGIEINDGDTDNIGCDNEDVAGCDISG